jgi:hypothetical protein
MQRQIGISVACLGAAGLGAVADAGLVPIALAIIFGCVSFLHGLFHRPEAEAIPRRRKMLAAFCALPVVFLLLEAAYVHQYRLYTPADLKSLDICIDTDIWGGSATMFGYVAIKCSSRDVLEHLSSTELIWGWALLPPETLRYVFEGNKVVGIKIIERGTEYRLDRDSKCFIQIKGRRTGLVGDCYLPPYPYRLP